MSRKQKVRCAFLITAATIAAVIPQSMKAQTFSAQITGSPNWQKGAATVTWTYSGTPPTLVSQYGVKVVAIQMAGANTTYMLTPQAVSFSARQTSLAANFTYTQNTTLQIVLEDSNGNKITPPYTVTFKPSLSVVTPPAPPGNPTYAAAACNYVFGEACTGSYAQFGSYLVAPGNGSMFTTQAAMQNYLINQAGTNPGVKSDIISRAAGSQACTGAITALTGAFTANPANPPGNGLWNSYSQLTSIAPGVVKGQCMASPAQLAAALNAAFSKLALQAPTAAQASAMASVTDPNAMAGAVRSYIGRDKTLQGQIVTNTYKQIYGGSPTAAIQSQLVAAYASRWTASDDLATFLNANKTTYAAPAPTPTPIPKPLPPTPVTPFQLTVTSPHQGEVYKEATPVHVTWTYTGQPPATALQSGVSLKLTENNASQTEYVILATGLPLVKQQADIVMPRSFLVNPGIAGVLCAISVLDTSGAELGRTTNFSCNYANQPY